jgi:hypothetical protein
MNTKTPAMIFLVLGIIFIVFSKLILGGIRWLDKTTGTKRGASSFRGTVVRAANTNSGWLWFSVFRGLLVLFSFGSLQIDN